MYSSSGVPHALKMLLSSSLYREWECHVPTLSSEFVGKIGPHARSSPKMQPADQMSVSVL